jgi:uncharacterized DUF497 family protein
MPEFRWNEWNLGHAAEHGVSRHEAESVVRHARRPYPTRVRPSIGPNPKWIVEGRGQGDRMVRVVYVTDPDDTIYVIHAMPLTTRRRRGGN